MKTNESIQKNIRGCVQNIIYCNLYSDRERTMKWILLRFEAHDKKLSLEHLIELSSDYSAFLPPNPYTADTMSIYKDLGLKEIMNYNQFIFELPRMWYTTLFRLIQEWKSQSTETELAY